MNNSARILPAGTIAHQISDLNEVFVIDRGTMRYLAFLVEGRLRIQSAMDLLQPQQPCPAYVETLFIAIACVPSAMKVLSLGLGGGSVYRAWKPYLPLATFHFIEIDPVVIELANSHFLPAHASDLYITAEDAALYVSYAPDNEADIIVVDLYTGPRAPACVTDLGFVRQLRRCLSPMGVVVVNVSPSALSVDQAVCMYMTQFAAVQRYSADGNTVLLCAQREDIVTSLPLHEAILTASDVPIGRALQRRL